ncbi:hypothetical protein OQA88_777 [Cercophora sp. LCS_1]
MIKNERYTVTPPGAFKQVYIKGGFTHTQILINDHLQQTVKWESQALCKDVAPPEEADLAYNDSRILTYLKSARDAKRGRGNAGPGAANGGANNDTDSGDDECPFVWEIEFVAPGPSLKRSASEADLPSRTELEEIPDSQADSDDELLCC